MEPVRGTGIDEPGDDPADGAGDPPIPGGLGMSPAGQSVMAAGTGIWPPPLGVADSNDGGTGMPPPSS
jgi:hypothetical protein